MASPKKKNFIVKDLFKSKFVLSSLFEVMNFYSEKLGEFIAGWACFIYGSCYQRPKIHGVQGVKRSCK